MNRKEKALKVLEGLEADAVLLSDKYNMRYVSGFSGGVGYVYLSQKRQVIFTDFRYTIQAEQENEGFEVVEVENGAYIMAINKYLIEEKVDRVGVEEEQLNYGDFRKLDQKLFTKKLVTIGDAFTKLRYIKEKEELEKIEKAESICDLAFGKIIEIIKPGMTELEIAAHLEYIMKTNGAEGLSFDTIVASGINSAMCHAVPTSKKVENGDFVTMDFGCIYEGYCSDMTRTIVAGRASDEQRKIYQTVLDAQMAALEIAKAGMTGKDIDFAARDIIRKAGYKNCFGHGLGHGVGLYIHENPRLSPNEKNIIEAGMTETFEPGIYVKNLGGVRIEDLCVFTKDGIINFTHSDKKLIEL